MAIIIRQAQESDIPDVVSIWKSVGFLYPPWDNPINLGRKIKTQPGLFLVALDGDEVVGGVIGTYDGWAAYVNHLAADPRHERCTAIKRLLLSAIERQFLKLDVNSVFAFTFPDHDENDFFKHAQYTLWGSNFGWKKELTPTSEDSSKTI